MCILDSAGDHSDDRQSPQNQQSQPTQAEFDRGDSSWPLYSLYSKIAEEEDKLKTERYQKDADAILIFVSPHVNFSFACRTQPEDIGWFILGHPRRIYWNIFPRPETKLSGYRCVLSHADLSNSRRPERRECFDTVYFGHPPCVLSTNICHLGEHTLVLELGHRPYGRNGGDVRTGVGTPIHQDRSTITIQSGQGSADPYNLC